MSHDVKLILKFLDDSGFVSQQTQADVTWPKDTYQGGAWEWGTNWPLTRPTVGIQFPLAGYGSGRRGRSSRTSVREVGTHARPVGYGGPTRQIGGATVSVGTSGAGVFEDTADTDWDEVYRQYTILNPEGGTVATHEFEREEDMAIPWGDIFSGAIDIWQGQNVGGGVPAGMAPPSSYVPMPGPLPSPLPGVRIDPRTGKPVCKRRRRRRLLTEGDFNDLMRISTLPNKENVRIALAKSIGRR